MISKNMRTDFQFDDGVERECGLHIVYLITLISLGLLLFRTF